MKVGILTYHRSISYGAFLQAVCLCNRLNLEPDISAEIIDYDMQSIRNTYQNLVKKSFKRRIKKFIFLLCGKDFIDILNTTKAFERGYEKAKPILSKDFLLSDNVEDFVSYVKGKYDVIISGSDEIWKIKLERGFPNPYFLPGEIGCRKFSYAASSRMDFNTLPNEQHKILNEYLNDYEFISVRDKVTYNSILNEGISKDKLMVSCDPSFLYDFLENDNSLEELLKGKCKLDPKKKILVLADIRRKTALSIISQVKDEYNIISTVLKNPKCINLADLDQFEWRLLISKADMVVTSLFHGICFSIANNTPFVVISRGDKKSKIDDLLQKMNLEDHCIEENDVSNQDFKKLFASVSKNANYRDFVLKQRKEFDIFLSKLRGEND